MTAPDFANAFEDLLPRPRHCELKVDHLERPAALRLDPPLPQRADGLMLSNALERLNVRLRKLADGSATVLPLSVRLTQADPSPVPRFGVDERYRLTLQRTALRIDATTRWGALHALETLGQLLFGTAERLPLGVIEDAPRFPWRGLMLDPARHFLPIAVLERTLDCMAAAHLNVLHLHLTDDQAFRFRSQQFPRLASPDSYEPHALKALVRYAAERGIRIVPELDVPGHVTHWLVAYPGWAPTGADGQSLAAKLQPTARFGVHPAALDPLRAPVREALGALIDELCEVFPDECLHLGGDEVHPGWWQQSPALDASADGAVAALQARFNRFLHGALTARDRRMVAWDEVLHPELTGCEPPVIVQTWRGATTRDRALVAGHPCILSSGYYLDLHYPAHWHYRYDPAASQAELLALEDELLSAPGYEGVADGMRWTHQWRSGALTDTSPPSVQQTLNGPPAPRTDSGSAAGLLGGEACLWGELVDAHCLDLRLWDRLPAIAERLWSAQADASAVELRRRTEAFQRVLKVSNRNDLPARQRAGLLAAGVPEPWQPLLAWFEPVKWYARLLGMPALRARLAGQEMPQARPYQVSTPLTGIADHLPVESASSLRLEAWVTLGGHERAARRWCEDWRSALPEGAPPAILAGSYARLEQLQALCEQRLASGVLSGAMISNLAEPDGELLLAPLFVLKPWLLADGELDEH